VAGNTQSDFNYFGGGIFNSNATLTVNYCFLANNSALGEGGLYSYLGNLLVSQSTLTGNSAAGDSGVGGGIEADFCTLLVTNSIVADNAATFLGADIYRYNGSITNGWTNLVQNIYDENGTVNGSYINSAPKLSSLGNYGGPTMTMPPLPGSPAIDAGAATSLTTDQLGFPRVVGPAPDIDAVEFQASPIMTTEDSIPGSLRYAITYVSNNATMTFDPSLSGATALPSSSQAGHASGLVLDFEDQTSSNLHTKNKSGKTRPACYPASLDFFL
jgi:fibronectin-binding autotransporter adhesin